MIDPPSPLSKPGATVLMLGGSSLLGSALRALADWPPSAFWTYRTGSRRERHALQLDLLDETWVRRVVERIAPTHVLDTALPAREDPAAAQRAIRHFCRILRRCSPGARYLLVSSDAVFAGDRGRPYREEDPVDPCSSYGRAKAAVEGAVRTSVESWCVARTGLLYGADRRGDRPRLCPRTDEVVSALRAGRRLAVYSAQFRTPTWLDDLAPALLRLLFSEQSGTWHLAGPCRCSRAELARETARTFGLDPEMILDQPLPEEPAFGRDTSLDCSKARSRLGWNPASVPQGLTRLASQLREGV
jgi:dTDP-4-dehydrorhamnose reductase